MGNSRKFSLALIALGALSLVVPAIAGEQVPFRGTDSGTFTVSFTGPATATTTDRSTGNATYLGAYTLSARETVTFSATGPASVTGGTAIFTAANGDELVVSYNNGTAVPIDSSGDLESKITATVTGGTGRFAGATGTLLFDSVGNLATGQFTEQITGTLSSPGAAGG